MDRELPGVDDVCKRAFALPQTRMILHVPAGGTKMRGVLAVLWLLTFVVITYPSPGGPLPTYPSPPGVTLPAYPPAPGGLAATL